MSESLQDRRGEQRKQRGVYAYIGRKEFTDQGGDRVCTPVLDSKKLKPQSISSF